MESAYPGHMSRRTDERLGDVHLIETIRVEADGTVPLLARHMARLQASCTALGYACDVAASYADILHATRHTQRAGPSRLRMLTDRLGQRTIEVTPLAPLTAVPPIRWAPTPLASREWLLRHKTTYRPWYEAAAQWLNDHPDIFDLVFLNERDELCEGSRSNVYLQLQGGWYTPPLVAGCLPGVTRAALLEEGKVQERFLTRADVQTATGIRLSNALRGWFDVTVVPSERQRKA